MFTTLLNEKATLNKVIGRNEYGEEAYGEDIEIKCRIEDGIKMVRNPQGDETVSTAVVYTNYLDISLNDKVNGRSALSIKKMKEANGTVIGLGVYLK